MAIHKIVAVRDRAIEAYGQPVFVLAVGAAIRGFMDEVNRSDSPMNAHPEDYDLFLMGEYDDNSGQIVPVDRPRQLAIGKEMIQRKE